MEKKKRYFLAEEDIPRYWYNIQADMVNKPMPPLNPATKQPLKPEDLYPIFAEELSRQELNQTDAWIEIPEEVREMYKYYRSTPLVRAMTSTPGIIACLKGILPTIWRCVPTTGS